MVDDSKPPAIAQVFQIPQGLINQWIEIPERANITANFTRQDLDNLFFSITKAGLATFHLQQALILYSQGKMDEANKQLAESQRQNVESDNNVRMFMSAIMASAKVAPP